MELKEYLKKNNIKINDLAEFLNVHRNHLSGIVNKRFVPSLILARQIVKFTKGEVALENLISQKEEGQICPCCKRKLAKGAVIEWPPVK